ncbi:MAG: ComEA family DNA-binding protein [bacterium]
MGLSRSERLVLVLLSVAIVAGRAARFGCDGSERFDVVRAERATAEAPDLDAARAETLASAASDSQDTTRHLAAIAPKEREAQSELEVSALSPLDLNAASAQDFESLPGIGPAKAKAIVERRESVGGFRAVSDLLDVPGIGPKTLARFQSLVFVKGAHRDDARARTEEKN